MDNPITKGYRGFTEKYQPITISQDKIQSAFILIGCIVLCGVICLVSSCNSVPSPVGV